MNNIEERLNHIETTLKTSDLLIKCCLEKIRCLEDHVIKQTNVIESYNVCVNIIYDIVLKQNSVLKDLSKQVEMVGKEVFDIE